MKKKHRKILVVSLFFALIVFAGVSTTYSYLVAKSNSATNAFSGTQINIGVEENGKIHENSSNNVEIYEKFSSANQTIDKVVTIKNMDGDSYVRVKLVPIVKNSADQTILMQPNLTYNFENGTDWKTDGTNYYYTSELKYNQTSEVLLESVTLNEALPSGCYLELQVLTDAIAARPFTNLKEAWDIADFSGMQQLK